MVYGLFRALPGDRALLPPSPLRSLLLKNLTPASRRQDHTTSPSASGALVRSTLRVHRIPPHVRDDRETPLWETGRGNQYYCFYRIVKKNSEIPNLFAAPVFRGHSCPVCFRSDNFYTIAVNTHSRRLSACLKRAKLGRSPWLLRTQNRSRHA